jgi:isoleucyl-tRNA synthetase
MPFAKVNTQVDFPAQERATLAFWERIRAFDRLREQNRGKARWSFLDGPITANNPMGVHHAWGRTYKDAFQRYHAMTGHDQRYQNGFDCQGLWVEVEVEREFKLKSKQDIENLVPGDKFASIDKFVQQCKERVDKFARRQTDQSIRLGMWMDWDRGEDWQKPPDQRRSYFTNAQYNNYAIWHFLKKCSDRKLMYRAFDSMPWCPRCAVGISQMEMHEGYKLTVHRSVFVKLPLRERPGENLLIWTTTPWTLSSNVGAAVNPELAYLRVKHQEQVYYVAKGAFTANRLEEDFKKGNWVDGVPKLKPLSQIFKEKGGYEVVGEVKGAEMLGWTYDGPFDELPAQSQPHGFPAPIADVVKKQNWAPAVTAKAAHRVIKWDAVGETEGTGIVHIAPGCGKEDFSLGKENGLPPLAPLDEEGRFHPGYGPLEGKLAYEESTVDFILENLKGKGVLLAMEKYPHNYPHCWRCKTELLFRLVDEWFISMSWRDEIIKTCHDITWIPDFGYQRELDWLKNMGDWMISKKRYWGLALPIWVDTETGDFEVIGSRDELKSRAVEGWDKFEGHSPHRPWIDLVKIRNPKNGNLMSRIPDVGNPWLDAGIVPYSTMGYFTNRDEWQKWFPADFITECFPGQFRNWFYALLAMSAMLEGRAPFKTLLGHALVRDEHGEEMHKSKGNAIAFEAAADEGWTVKTKDGKEEKKPPMGADLMRWLYCRQNATNNINFGSGPAEELRSKFVLKLWNTYAFFCNYAVADGFDPKAPQVPLADRPDIDRWILSDLQLLINAAHDAFKEYHLQSFCLEAEDFVDERLSNWYVRRNRRRFWKSEKSQDKLAAYQTLYTVLTTLCRLFAPIMPFLMEEMYQNLVAKPEGKTDGSVHLLPYPEMDAKQVDADLSADMRATLRLVSLGSAARNTVKIKVRQPLAELKVQSADERDRRAVERFADQITEELNIKRAVLQDAKAGSLARFEVKANLKTLGPKLGPRLKEVQAALAQADAGQLASQLKAKGSVELSAPSGSVVLAAEDVQITPKGPEGWAVVTDKETVVAIDTRITEDLKLEGLAREVVRYVQNLRKDAGLEMEDRIALHHKTDSPQLQQAIQKHKDYIMAETLTVKWSNEPLGDGAAKVEAKIEGQLLQVELRKA